MVEEKQTPNELNPNQEINQIINPQELTEEDIKEIIRRTEEEGREEAKYFLRISLFSNYCHPSGKVYKEKYEIVAGRIKEITERELENTCTKTEDLVVIPLTRKVVLIKYNGFDDDEPEEVYVFDFQRGWRSLYL